MKKIGIIACFFGFLFTSCLSTNNVVNPKEITYEKITAQDFFDSSDESLFTDGKAYKVTDVYIIGASKEYNEAIIYLGKNLNSSTRSVYATDYVVNMNNTDPTWRNRIDSIKYNEHFNGHYVVYLYSQEVGDIFNGYTKRIYLYNIEGIPTQEEIDADIAATEAARIAEEEAKQKAKEEKLAKMNNAGKELANGYTYHGIDEVEKNQKYFANGALESGHAYYISGFIVKYGGSMAKIEYGDGFFFSSQSSAVYIDYVNQKVKTEVIDEGIKTLLGQEIEFPITVVVAGGKGITNIPVVLGVIKEE